LGSVLLDADSQLTQYTANFNKTTEQISDALVYLENLLFVNVDINGDGNISRAEMTEYLGYVSIYNKNMTRLALWCQSATPGSFCYGNSSSVPVQDMYNDAANNFNTAPYHTFDGSGVSVIASMTSTFPNPSFTAEECATYDSFSNPTTYKFVETNWDVVGPAGSINQVCGYSNGIVNSAFTSTNILDGSQTYFVDNNPVSQTNWYKRVYCINVAYQLPCGTTAGYQSIGGNCYSPCPIGSQASDPTSPTVCYIACSPTYLQYTLYSSTLYQCVYYDASLDTFTFNTTSFAREFTTGTQESHSSYTCSVGLFYDGTPIDLIPVLGFSGITFSFMDTSSTETEVRFLYLFTFDKILIQFISYYYYCAIFSLMCL